MAKVGAVNLDAQDRHLLAVTAVLVAAVAVGLPLAGGIIGLAVRCFVWAAGVGP